VGILAAHGLKHKKDQSIHGHTSPPKKIKEKEPPVLIFIHFMLLYDRFDIV